MGSQAAPVLEARTRPTPAQVALFEAGRTAASFARFHGTSDDWVYRVLRGTSPPPARFVRDLSRFLDQPVEKLFPGWSDD